MRLKNPLRGRQRLLVLFFKMYFFSITSFFYDKCCTIPGIVETANVNQNFPLHKIMKLATTFGDIFYVFKEKHF